MEYTYRMTVWGRFTALTSDQRTQLLAEQNEHGMFSARFSTEGTFLYGPELVGYQFRYEVLVDDPSPDDAELLARMHVEETAATKDGSSRSRPSALTTYVSEKEHRTDDDTTGVRRHEPLGYKRHDWTRDSDVAHRGTILGSLSEPS